VPILKENPGALALARTIARVAQDKKASDVLVIDTRLRGAAVGYDYVVLASGDSDRQLVAIADAVEDTLQGQGTRATSIEAASDWVLVNYTDVVAHFFTPDKRTTYDLEGLWSDVPRVPLTVT
jgi:ribosome-associated protein